ncbi:hypothetical protein Hdeb2414_s0009g00316121 [Helianthus debilis subsp. tardiflorus]
MGIRVLSGVYFLEVLAYLLPLCNEDTSPVTPALIFSVCDTRGLIHPHSKTASLISLVENCSDKRFSSSTEILHSRACQPWSVPNFLRKMVLKKTKNFFLYQLRFDHPIPLNIQTRDTIFAFPVDQPVKKIGVLVALDSPSATRSLLQIHSS